MDAFHALWRRGSEADANSTHWDLNFNSTISDRDRSQCENEMALYTSTKSLLAEHMENPELLMYGAYLALSDTRVGCIAAKIHLYEPYGHKLLIAMRARKFLITGRNCFPQTGHSDVIYHQGKVRCFLSC